MNVRLSVYNVLMITLIAILGIFLAKMAFTKWEVPGVSTVVQAA